MLRFSLILVLVLTTMGCMIDGSDRSETGLGIQITFGSDIGQQAISTLSTEGTITIFIVDERSFSPDANVVARIEAALKGTESPGTAGAATALHRELSFPYASGSAGNTTIDGLSGNVRFFVIVMVEYADVALGLVQQSGFTRIVSIPGATVTANITVGDRFDEVVTNFEEWYGIGIGYADDVIGLPPVFASGPGIAAEPTLPEPTPVDQPEFAWTGGGNGTGVFGHSIDGGTTWVETAATTVQLGPLTPGEYTFRVREKGESGTWSEPIIAYFEVIAGDFATITITNPTEPEFVISPAGFTLDRSSAETIEISVSTTVTIDSYIWLMNGVTVGNTATLIVESTAAEVNVGVNALTLIVEIGGTPYSEDFTFSVVEN